MKVTLERAGLFTTVQDLGRTGFRDSGVPLGGAVDSHALRIANLLVGNDEGAAGLEFTSSKVRVRFEQEQVVAWCGGDFRVDVAGSALSAGRACGVSVGDELVFQPPEFGCRAWVAVSGGIDVPVVLGSRSTDLRASFGGFDGRMLRDNDALPLAPWSADNSRLRESLGGSKVADWRAPTDWSNTGARSYVLRIVRGSGIQRFKSAAWPEFISHIFTVTPESDRMGARLDGATLNLCDGDDLLSEAVTPGTIQVPPGGQSIILLADCQTIGGYPKIAHVITVDLSLAAQLRAGDRVRFEEVSVAAAQSLLLEREDEVRRFRIGVALRTV
jgi:antagonist of KipI